jgi:hypothetical protein
MTQVVSQSLSVAYDKCTSLLGSAANYDCKYFNDTGW